MSPDQTPISREELSYRLSNFMGKPENMERLVREYGFRWLGRGGEGEGECEVQVNGEPVKTNVTELEDMLRELGLLRPSERPAKEGEEGTWG